MAEKKPLNRGAKILKEKLDKERVKNANKRARKDAKPGSGTLSERVKKAAKKAPEKRGLPAIRKENLPAVRKENLPAVRKENLPAVRKENLPARIESKPAAKPRTFGMGAAGRLLGPAGALFAMTTPAGEGSDKPSGPLMRGNSLRYEDQSVNRAGKGDLPKPAARPPIPKARPTNKAKAAEFKAKMQGRKKVAAKPAAKPAAQRVAFKGNWVGAAPTEMQKRGGRRIQRPNLIDFLKSKRK